MGNIGSFFTSEQPESFSLDELTFCDPLPDMVELECPICFQVMLHNPCLVSCCGHHFCSYCITQAKISNKNCPYCKKHTYETMEDKGLARIIKSLRVKCIQHSRGCRWQGDLSALEDHLSRKKREGDCLFTTAGCRYACGHKDERGILSEHETNTCPNRPYTCSYCGLKLTFIEVTNAHTNVCPRYPITCPNLCDQEVVLERRYMKDHLKTSCPLTIVPCDYQQEGCNWKGHRRESTCHYSENCHQHLKAVCEKTRLLAAENEQLKSQIKELSNLSKKAASELRRQSGNIERLEVQVQRLQQQQQQQR